MPLPAFLADTPSSVRRLVAAGLVALLAFMVVAVAANGQTSSGHYRTATATTSSVDQVLQSVATIEPVTQAAVAFPIAGTVDSVEVGVGDRVASAPPSPSWTPRAPSARSASSRPPSTRPN